MYGLIVFGWGLIAGLIVGTLIEHNNEACLTDRLTKLRAKWPPPDEAERERTQAALNRAADLEGLRPSGWPTEAPCTHPRAYKLGVAGLLWCNTCSRFVAEKSG